MDYRLKNTVEKKLVPVINRVSHQEKDMVWITASGAKPDGCAFNSPKSLKHLSKGLRGTLGSTVYQPSFVKCNQLSLALMVNALSEPYGLCIESPVRDGRCLLEYIKITECVGRPEWFGIPTYKMVMHMQTLPPPRSRIDHALDFRISQAPTPTFLPLSATTFESVVTPIYSNMFNRRYNLGNLNIVYWLLFSALRDPLTPTALKEE